MSIFSLKMNKALPERRFVLLALNTAGPEGYSRNQLVLIVSMLKCVRVTKNIDRVSDNLAGQEFMRDKSFDALWKAG